MSKLVCEGITKIYGKKEVLSDVDLVLERGKIYGLLGRNGAGKTTLLSVMTAQNPASRGRVTFDGQPVWENQKVLDHLCFARELSTMLAGASNPTKVKEYLRIAACYYPNWDRKMADRLIDEFDLDVKKKIGKLSKGMLSMVTIVIAMASKAEFTLLDEPAAGLDVVSRDKFYRILLEEHSETGRTFVISTHIIEEAADIFEEVIFIKDGKILLKEDTQDLLERALHVSGHQDEVDAATISVATYNEEHLGRSKGVDILLEPGQMLSDKYDVTVQRLSLQKLFLALCGEEVKQHE